MLDDLVQFVSGNTLGGSWQKPQLRKRCEEFLENADIDGGGGGTPDRITVGMLETFDWTTVTVNINQETGTMSISGEDIENVLGISEDSTPEDCSFKFKIPDGINPPIVYVFDSFGENHSVIYKDTASGTTSMQIIYHDSVALIAEGEEPVTLSYNSVDNVYENGR